MPATADIPPKKPVTYWEELQKVREEISECRFRLTLLMNKERDLVVECEKLLRVFPERLLTRRENEILTLLIRNPAIQNKEIASYLNIEVRTVKAHMSNLLLKFKVINRAELVSVANLDVDKG